MGIYDDMSNLLWRARTQARAGPPYDLLLQDDGNLVLWGNNKRTAMWSTRSCHESVAECCMPHAEDCDADPCECPAKREFKQGMLPG
ncbi:hypothetical protein T484DRAFT_1846490 [Baffinella frigidus]|nr:hypothetical protein T484DRAFT_1846490 [Cryptophyta sp. CCMP2293]